MKKKFPHYVQHEIMDCGPTCIKIVAKYFGKDWSLSFLKDISGTTKLGSNFKGLAKAAEAIGLRSLPVRVDFNKLKNEAPFPCVVHWKQNHFVVVYKITSKYVYISDPAHGLLKYSHKDFLRYWMNVEATDDTEEGIALLLEPTISFFNTEVKHDKDNSNRVAIKFIKHYLFPHKNLFLQVLMTLLLGSILQLAIPILTQNVIDIGISNKDIGFIWLVLLAQLMIAIGNLSLEWFRSWTLLILSNKMNLSLISDFFVKLMKLPIRFFDMRLSGDLMQRIQDHRRIQDFLTGGSLSTIFSVFNFFLYGALLCYYNLLLFFIFLAGSTVYVLWVFVFLKRRAVLDFKRFQEAGATTSKVIELIDGMQEIKINNAEQQKRWEWERAQIRLYKVGLKSLTLEQIQSTGSRIINDVKNIFITIVSAKLVIDGEISLGMMLSISYIIGQLNAPVTQFIGIIKRSQDAKLSLIRLLEIHNKDEESIVDKVSIPPNHTFSLQNVSFRYDNTSNDVINSLNFSIPKNHTTAIVGSSGSGKTTLLKLLMSYYTPTEGVIQVDKTNLKNINLKDWRDRCGVVMQEGHIFNDTISGNIAVGDEMPNQNQLERVARLADIHDFVESLPLKYNTKIGKEGLGLSTGQKQRVRIARALYRNPDIIFLDEATSALDAKTENVIINNLQEYFKGKTVVVVAHRLSTVKNADNIIVLDKGGIIEQGTHLELTALKGEYYHLVKNQLELGN